MTRIACLGLLCAGMLLSGSALAENFCQKDAGDPQLSFPGTANQDVFGVRPDASSTTGYDLFLCAPKNLDISWLASYSFGDFDHDGFEDLMFGRSSNGAGAVDLFLNDKTGSGTVVLSATLPTGAGAAPVAVDALDLDGDGWDDIVTANGSDGTFTVMLNDGTGAFPTVQQYAAGSDVTLLAAVDVNGDGFPDVITESTQDQTVSVFLNNGDGTFAAPMVYHVGGPVSSLSVADLNGDGHPDIYVTSVAEINLFATTPPPSTAGGTQEFVNNGDGTFTADAWKPYSLSTGGGSISFTGADVTVTAVDLSALLGAGGSSSAGITVHSGGTIKVPTGQGTATKVGGTSPGKSTAPMASAGGGGAMEWLSLMLLGFAGLLRRKRI